MKTERERAVSGDVLKITPSMTAHALPLRLEVERGEAFALLLPCQDIAHVVVRVAAPMRVSAGPGARMEHLSPIAGWISALKGWLLRDPVLPLPSAGATLGLRAKGRKGRKALRKDLKILNLFGLGAQLLCMERDAGLALGFSAAPPQLSAMRPTRLRLGVVAHLHFTDVWGDLEASLRCIPHPFGLIVTLTAQNLELERAIKAAFPDARIEAVPNVGRDVRPFLALLDAGDLDGFDVVCKIHGKKSLREGRPTALGELWRRSALYDLVAGPGRLDEALAARLGLASEFDLDFFAGTMFWVRPKALAPLRGAGLGDPATYAPEAGHTDGAVEHALERLFTCTAKAAGFSLGALRPLPDARSEAS